MTTLKIVIPTYEKGSRCFDETEAKGHIEITSECDNLSEGYQQVKVEIDRLLEKIQAENQIITDFQKITEQINQKNSELRQIQRQIKEAGEQYQRLKNFLNRLGISATDYTLIFREDLKLEAETKSVSIVDDDKDPIPM